MLFNNLHDISFKETNVGYQQHELPSIVNDVDICNRKVFVGGLSWVSDENKLREYFEAKNCNVESILIMRDNMNRSRGFGFVIFRDAASVSYVLGSNHVLDGRKIEVKRALPKGEIKTRKIFVGGVPMTVSDEEFKVYFQQFGKVSEANIMKDRNTGHPRGFGFVSYENEMCVERVLATTHELKGKKVEVKKAEPKKVRPSENTTKLSYVYQPPVYYPQNNYSTYDMYASSWDSTAPDVTNLPFPNLERKKEQENTASRFTNRLTIPLRENPYRDHKIVGGQLYKPVYLEEESKEESHPPRHSWAGFSETELRLLSLHKENNNRHSWG